MNLHRQRRLKELRSTRNELVDQIIRCIGVKMWSQLFTTYKIYLKHHNYRGDKAFFIKLWDAFKKDGHIYPSHLLDFFIERAHPDYLLYLNQFILKEAA